MSVEELLARGSIHRFDATHGEVEKALEVARRDRTLAEKLLHENLDWCFAVAYNSVFQACRAYMFHLGYRPASVQAHKATFQFIQVITEEPLSRTASYFDQVRKKRHRTVYDDVGSISEKEAKGLLERAKEFLSYVESEVKQ